VEQKAVSELKWTLTKDGKANLVIEGMSMEQIVFVCEKIKLDVVSGLIANQSKKDVR
jgi:hypothetical protein